MRQQVDNAVLLEECRRNPALAAAQRPGLVVCLECGLLVRRLTRSPKCHARNEHKLDAKAYLDKWPGAPLASVEAERDERHVREVYLKTHRKKLKESRKEYRKRPEVKARENENRRKRWPGWYADHRESERERGKAKHQRFRARDNKRTKLRYQANLEAERARHREKQRQLRELARAAPAAQQSRPAPKSPGRPRKDEVAERVLRLKAKGKSWAELTRIINRENKASLGVDAYRGLVRRAATRAGMGETRH